MRRGILTGKYFSVSVTKKLDQINLLGSQSACSKAFSPRIMSVRGLTAVIAGLTRNPLGSQSACSKAADSSSGPLSLREKLCVT
ncbi:MAG: hypothetical protein FWG91_12015 [Lachnospiraceae bacterium]|nr:hypothetical protein [Lachnospiraceae bacterium]